MSDDKYKILCNIISLILRQLFSVLVKYLIYSVLWCFCGVYVLGFQCFICYGGGFWCCAGCRVLIFCALMFVFMLFLSVFQGVYFVNNVLF